MEEIIKRITEEVLKNMKMEAAGTPGQAAAVPAAYEYMRMDPAASVPDIVRACEEAMAKGYASIYVPQWFLEIASDKLKGSKVALGTIVGLPGGTTSTSAKYAEVNVAIKNGAQEIAIPLNMEMIKAGRINEAKNDLSNAMVPAADGKVIVKALVEVENLTPDVMKVAMNVANDCGCSWVVLSFVLRGEADIAAIAAAAAAAGGKMNLSVFGGLPQNKLSQVQLKGVERIGASYTI